MACLDEMSLKSSMNTLVIVRIVSGLTRYSQKRFWRLWSEFGTTSATVLQDELEEAHWLEDEAKRLADFMLQIPAGQVKSLDAPVVIKFLRDRRSHQVTGVVKGPEAAEIRPQLPAADQDWITALATQIRDQVTPLRTTIQEQQNRIVELQNEVGDKQSRIDELIARITLLESEIADKQSQIDKWSETTQVVQNKAVNLPSLRSLLVPEESEEMTVATNETLDLEAEADEQERDSLAAAGEFHPVDKSFPLEEATEDVTNSMQAEKIQESDFADVEADAELPGFLQRPADTPADLLTDLHVIAKIIGVNESDTARLIAVMMKHGWECTLDDLKTAFRRDASVTFVNVIMDDINERAQAEINDNLMFEEDGRWEILEDYRDEIEYILTHSEYRQ